MSLKTIAVIPVKGRLPLLKVTLTRLYEKNKVGHVICVGSEDERALCESCGAEFHEHKNNPLGKKWNYGFLKAKEHNPDAVVYVGSSDWLSDNWLNVLLPFVDRYPIVGKMDYNMVHVSDVVRLAWWPSYRPGSGRENELIGIGRLLSSEFLDAINWQPFFDDAEKGMDGAMYLKLGECQKKGFRPALSYNFHEIQSLSVSCDKWNNMHLSDFNQPGIVKFRYPEYWLKLWFPEALTLEL